MGKLHPLYRPEVEINKSIVDILTTNEFRTSIWWKEYPKQRFPEIIGLNSVCQGKPVRLSENFYERGLEDSKNNLLYLIFSEKKILYFLKRRFNLFYDLDKVDSRNQFLWEGSFDEIIKEFQKKDYSIKEFKPV